MSSAQTKPAFRVYNGLAPEEMPKGMPWVYDFSADGDQSFDLQLENTGGIIQMVQSIFVDNSDNADAVTIRFSITNQRLVVPAGAQGIWPVIAPLQTQIRATTTPAAELLVSIILLNVPMPYTQWGPITVNTGAITATTEAMATAAPPAYAPGLQPISQDLTGNLRVTLLTQLPAGANNIGSVDIAASVPLDIGTIVPVDIASLPGGASATLANVAAANADTLLLAANANRLGGSIVNDSTDILYISLGASAASATDFSYVIEGKTTVGGILEIPADWRGEIRGFWAGTNGAARVTERA